MKRKFLLVTMLTAAMLMVLTPAQASAQDSEDNPAEVESGQTVYAGSCAGCHGNDGEGSSRGRPLTGIAEQGDRATHFASVSDGKGGMPAFGERLSVEQIDAALSYVRLTFVADAAAADDADAGDDDAGDDAAADDAAASSDELAETGAETPLVAIGGLTLVAAGALLVRTSRRTD